MKANLCLAGMLLLCAVSCTKSEVEPLLEKATTSSIPTANTAAILTDPVDCPATLYQSNANAFQLNFTRMKLIRGMTGQLKNITSTALESNAVHVYLRSASEKYYHLPATTDANVSYNYSLTSSSPQSSITITRGAGPEEIFETVIVLGTKTSYLSCLTPQLNFADYGSVKMKLGF